MNPGVNQNRFPGARLRRQCARAGCATPAVTTLRFEPTLRQAWLVDLDEAAARTQGDLCRRHAEALVLPRGWKLHDERTDGPRPVEQPPAAPVRKPPRRARVRARGAAVEAQPAESPSQLPGFAPAAHNGNGSAPVLDEFEVETRVEAEVDEDDSVPAVTRPVPAQFGANDGDDEVDAAALNAVLDARTPLLQRAFRNAQPRD